MRLFLLPISTRRSLIYCQKGIASSPRQLTWLNNPVEKATTRGSETWLEWEKYKEGWRKKVTVYGNKLFQRLPFEEWGLKSVPPLTAKRKEEGLQGKIKSHVEYPKSLLRQEAVREALQKYGSNERQNYHRKWFWGSVIGMPLSAPAALVPVGSEHIEFLVKNNLFETRPSSALDTAYAESSIGVSLGNLQQDLNDSQQADSTLKMPAEQMLLSEADGILIADSLQIPELAPEVERAVWQIEREIKIQKGHDEKMSKLDSLEQDKKRNR
ncbi:MAG: hypothetical protein Q9195_007976 [Heterodermia aff. obscurata]